MNHLSKGMIRSVKNIKFNIPLIAMNFSFVLILSLCSFCFCERAKINKDRNSRGTNLSVHPFPETATTTIVNNKATGCKTTYLSHNRHPHNRRTDTRRWVHCRWICRFRRVDRDHAFHRHPSYWLSSCCVNSATNNGK